MNTITINATTPSAVSNRRQWLMNAGGGAGMVALTSLLGKETAAEQTTSAHFSPRAKRVIWLFMDGGPSHMDLFDPKPDLVKYSGHPLPESFGNVMTRRDVAQNPLLGPIKPFRPRGQSGLEISDFLPHTAACADEILVIRSVHGDSVNHPQSVYQMNTGSLLMGRPSVGQLDRLWIGDGESGYACICRPA